MTRMAQLLGEEYAQFAQSFASAAHVGLRVNTLKISAADFISKAPFALTPVGAFEPACFRVVDDSRPGRLPLSCRRFVLYAGAGGDDGGQSGTAVSR